MDLEEGDEGAKIMVTPFRSIMSSERPGSKCCIPR